MEEAAEEEKSVFASLCECRLDGLEGCGNYLKRVIICGCLSEVNPPVLKSRLRST